MSEENTQNVEGTEIQEQENNVDNATENQETNTQEPEKNFTQADVDALIKKRLERERSKMPPKEDLEAFKEWKKSQQTEQEKLAEERKEFEATRQELSRLRNEKEVLKSGVDSKFSDYVTYEVGKMEGDFVENLSEFMKSNPQFSTNQATTTPSIQAGGQKIKNEAGNVDESQLSDEEYFRRREKK